MNKQYIVTERNEQPLTLKYLREGSDIDNINYSVSPRPVPQHAVEHHPPIIFDSRSEAVKFKNEAQRFSDNDWDDMSYYTLARMKGYKKPKWKVEQYNGELR